MPHPPSSAALFYDECVERLHDVALHARRRAEEGGKRFTAGVEYGELAEMKTWEGADAAVTEAGGISWGMHRFKYG